LVGRHVEYLLKGDADRYAKDAVSGMAAETRQKNLWGVEESKRKKRNWTWSSL
jgi:hypothetical protein